MKTILIIGANNGIGFETAKQLDRLITLYTWDAEVMNMDFKPLKT